MEQDKNISICSEKQIVKNYIQMVDRIVCDINEVEKNDPPLTYVQTYFDIVQSLLLNGTDHSGGTSTRKKCKELGFDYSEGVIFGEVPGGNQ